MNIEEKSLLRELLKKHDLSSSLISKLKKESNANMYEQRSEAKKLHELEALIAVQISEDRGEK
ncbi:hypothetical protein F9802_08875 [Bacillus aerolatus]|uniref:Uncharacterized protein n=1 Tax=Bacillus aerolatus TaxID=2653354 RepID=A0A6I1FG22_9BACI|nr:DNA modification system-associated small protein [Bacillus aerolatus]KAB7707114.1 hypothetical protein F9802_08875 [Bacillus aerolatus]